ncbi:MAG: repair protein RecO protein [Candidatus Woesebacteria bacterium GW2011_GWB1_43_14]|uniref:DNA repair protein RecO n=1 Tax=Candidatus Woesebacteria bacterium GW2011_GWB1_43_14 TaxID=1618578 RepID=A0A0G1DHL4_9BACT|nr:MAG: repair protein RecO protein [Candidatus Woesebacteria bacterium GW2011_GWC1_42_9]KKS97169.1 MAG: repair protein RecO protein [Candidatus Woesebacteria bacterium GW2011_GWB1_43_14]
MGRTYVSDGVVLASRDYSEADKILVVLSKDFGRVSLIAKGVKKLKSRKRGHVEIFNHIKFQAARGKSLDIITEAEIINAFSRVRKNLVKTSVAYYFAEVIGRTTRDHERNEVLYGHLLDSLTKLQKSENLKELRRDFAVRALEILGFWPKNKKIADPDRFIEEILERELASIRVGKRLQG